jgi:cytochrome o ubiquinol oxidase subunit I
MRVPISMLENLLGRLDMSAFEHDKVVWFAVSNLVMGVLTVLALITITKRWTWLYQNWLTTLDHKKIGIMYLITAIVMLARGGIDTIMLRAQQIIGGSGSSTQFLPADHFQQVFTAHGTIMIFFVAMGLMFALVNLILPLQIGARDVAFPFLNAFSFWLFIAGAMLMNVSLAIGEFSAAGWLAYPPLSGISLSPGVGVDYWIWALQISGLGSLLSGVNIIATIVKMRRPGMTMMKMPIFTWSVFGAMMLVVASFPILTATLAMLSLDRLLGFHFFTADGGGNAMMYVNLIWAWGHPEVYILVLPAFGIFSEVVATFSQKKLFGYTSMVYAIMAITVLSFLVWLHHFFTMGAGPNVNAFFGIMTMIIAVPTGVKIFNWLFTMYRGRVFLRVPMMWFLGFVLTFTIGGVTGVMMSVPAADFQLHNSLFLVAHFHNMIVGGVLFGYFAGITYWWPKVFGFALNERIGKLSFWFWIVGFCTAFIPLYILGFMGATRRLNSYDPSLGWQELFIVAGIGSLIIMAGLALQILQVIVSVILRNNNRDKTGDPWNGRTLEWSTPSPVPIYNFATAPPVQDRDAFWVQKQSTTSPKAIYEDIALPKNSPIAFIMAICIFFLGFGIVWHIWWLVATSFVATLALAIGRTMDDETEYVIPAKEVAKMDKLARNKYA